MIRLSIYRKRPNDDPQSYDIEEQEFATTDEALDFIIEAYKTDRGVLTAWNVPYFINTITSDHAGGSIDIGGRAESMDAFKLAVLVNKLIRNDKDVGRKLRLAELSVFRSDGEKLLARKDFTYLDGVEEKDKKLWQ